METMKGFGPITAKHESTKCLKKSIYVELKRNKGS